MVKVFYLPIAVGTYTHFGGIEINKSEVAFLSWYGTEWVKHSFNMSSIIDSIKSALDAASKAANQAEQAKSAADTNKSSIEGLTQTVGGI